MSVRDCIRKLVETGQISARIGQEALALHDEAAAGYRPHGGGSQAEAAAAVAAADGLAARIEGERYQLAMQALAVARNLDEQAAHPRGAVAGGMAAMVRDLWGHGRVNTATLTEVIEASLFSRWNVAMEAFKSRFAGLRQNVAGAERMVREIFGEDTGDEIAKAAARGWREVDAEAVRRARAAGRLFTPLDDWRLPQFWRTDRVRGREAEWQADIRRHVESGGVVVWDKETYRPVAAERLGDVLDGVARNIADGAGFGRGGSLSPEVRVIRFQNADAYLELMRKYGPGSDVFGMMQGHVRDVAREISLMETFGPNHRATFLAMLEQAREAERGLTTRQRLNPVRWYESAERMRATYDVLTGRANEVVSEAIAGFFGSARHLAAASKLQGAVISAVPGDSFTLAMTAAHNGLPAARLIKGVLREVTAGPEGRALAARLQVTAHAAMDAAVSAGRYEGEIAGPEVFRSMANFVIRAQGLQAWTDILKRTFTMEMLGHVADQTPLRFGELDGKFRDFLGRYAIDEADWNALRRAPLLKVDGGRFFDVTAVTDRRLGDKLMSGILDERAYAVLEADPRIQSMATGGGARRGTFYGEVVRSLSQFKAFPLTMIATHVMRVAVEGPLEARAWRGAAFVTFGTLAGALTVQAKQVLAGKDPRDMNSTTFWLQAFIQGGGAGIYGDLLSAGFTRSGNSLAAAVAGPVAGMAEDAAKLVFPQVRALYEGGDTSFGASAVRFGRNTTPGLGLWYMRLGVDRLLWDQLQMMLDPDWRASFRRMERRAESEYGQAFWWRPGESVPRRGPEFQSRAP